MSDTIWNLITRFNIRMPVRIVRGAAQALDFNYDEVVLTLDEHTQTDELIDVVAQIKLADADVLLSSWVFQPSPTAEEVQYMTTFMERALPLQRAWTFRVMREHAPELYAIEYADIQNTFFELVKTAGHDSYGLKIMLESYAIVCEGGPIGPLVLVGEHQDQWATYVARLRELIPKPADPRLYVELAEATNPPYRVRIVTDTQRPYYDVRRRREYCTQNDGDCGSCALTNYGRDCRNNPL